MKKYLSIFLVISLGGCATQFGERISTVISAVQSFTITQSQIDSARNSYDGFVLAPLAKYASLPRCKFNQKLTLNAPCHNKKLLKQIRETDKQVAISFSNTQSRIDSGDNTGASAAYKTLMETIDIVKSLIGQTGVSVLGV